MKINTLSSSIKAALAVSATIAAVSPAVYAEEQDANQAVVDKVERIEVTGSRISRVDLESTQPIETIDSEYISKRGTTNLASVLEEVPGIALAATANLSNNEEAASQGVGQSTVNLYGLGSQRTLSLVNGSRFVSSNSPVGGGSAPGSQVDINNIPVSLIERVEVVKVGGAPVYGADAVAGVVNFILKTDYEGAEFSADVTNYDEAGKYDKSFRGLFGGNFNEDKGNLVFSFEYQDQKSILASELPSWVDQWGGYTPLGSDAVVDADGNPVAGQRRLYPNGRAGILSNSGLITPGPTAVVNAGLGAWPDGSFLQFDPSGNGQLIPFNTGTPTGNAVWSSGGDGLDLAESNTAREGFERYNFTISGNYKLTDDINMSVLGFFNSSDAVNEGYQPNKYSSGLFSGLGAALKFDTDYVYLPSETRNRLENYLGGPGEFYMHKAWTSLGKRKITNESDVRSIKIGFDGYFELGENEWKWDVFYQQGVSKIFSQDFNINENRFLAAIDVGYNNGAIDCKANYVDGYHDKYTTSGFGVTETQSVLGEVGKCVAYNPFGPASQEVLDYITYPAMGYSRVEQDILQAFTTGDIIELPAGYLAAAFGYERRTEKASFSEDGTNVLNSGLANASTSGSYTTQDLFAEISLPLVSSDMDIPLVNTLSVDASFRRIDNDAAGKDNVWAVGLNYQPISDLMVRANYSETVRAPSVTELFLPVILDSQFGTDPCDINNIDKGPSPATRRANCEAAGVPAGYKAVSGNASRVGTTGGNVDLESEKAEGLNIGLVYAPEWFEGFSFKIDYIKIDIEDAIVDFTLTDILNACYDSTNYPNEFCGKFRRGADFQIPADKAFESGYVNAALQEFETYEYEVMFKRPLHQYPLIGGLLPENSGELGIRSRLYNLKKDAESNTGFDFEDNTGEYTNPDWRGDLRFDYTLEDINVYFDVEYYGEGNRNNDSTNFYDYIDQNGNPYNKIQSQTLYTLGGSYYLNDNAVVRFRVDNLFDWYPSVRELSVARYTYGRVFSAGFTYKF
ncbi:TonB-dependent receptor domain-containing protein [Pseudoalteromonas sp. NJ631]|uniref:TonB-dependent receptor domain-containing protein n=1 Tax=Pseudoalteromonas sp. NJ631 TaxID=493915 RepID=UPI0002DE7F0F|nr:TonB-dependent receptor [Pseudoalteromonas sp. NJ631]